MGSARICTIDGAEIAYNSVLLSTLKLLNTAQIKPEQHL